MTWDIGAIERQSIQPPDPIPPDPIPIPPIVSDVVLSTKDALPVTVHRRRKPNGKIDITLDKGVSIKVN